MLPAGTVIDAKYQVVKELGRGGMGAVFEARHLGTGRRVALKVIVREALAANSEVVARFEREARASGAIDSSHVVQVLDTGVDPQSGSPYLVMEYLAGEDLHHVIRRLGSLPPDLALRVIAQACAGLARAHDEGIVHRDIKAANLYLAKREEGDVVVKLLDFGIAKVRADPLSVTGGGAMTRTGALLGSPFYMSPEQVVGNKDIDGRSDVYSLGVTLFEALTGHTPYSGVDQIGALIFAICSGKGESIRTARPDLPASIVAVVERAMAVTAEARFASAAEMRAAIMALLPDGSGLHERMLVSAPTSMRLEHTAALPHSTPSELQAAGRLLHGATTPIGGMTPPAQRTPPPSMHTPVAPQASGGFGHSGPVAAMTMHGFGGTNPIPKSGPPIAAIVVAVLALLGIVGGLVVVKLRKPVAAATAASASVSHQVVAAPPPTEIVVPPAASSVAPAMSSSAIAEPPPVSAAPVVKPVPLPAMAPVPHPPPGPAVPAKPNCNPNFYIDKNGARHFKEECL